MNRRHDRYEPHDDDPDGPVGPDGHHDTTPLPGPKSAQAEDLLAAAPADARRHPPLHGRPNTISISLVIRNSRGEGKSYVLSPHGTAGRCVYHLTKDDGKYYCVQHVHGTWACTCEDYKYRGLGKSGYRCKHVSGLLALRRVAIDGLNIRKREVADAL